MQNHSWNSNSLPNKQEISHIVRTLSVNDQVYMCPTFDPSIVRLTQSTTFLLTARSVLMLFSHLRQGIPSMPFLFTPFLCPRYTPMLHLSQSPCFEYRDSIWLDVYVHTYVLVHMFLNSINSRQRILDLLRTRIFLNSSLWLLILNFNRQSTSNYFLF